MQPYFEGQTLRWELTIYGPLGPAVDVKWRPTPFSQIGIIFLTSPTTDLVAPKRVGVGLMVVLINLGAGAGAQELQNRAPQDSKLI